MRPQRNAPYSEDPAPPDSLTRRFVPLLGRGYASAYTLEIASALDKPRARGLFVRLDTLHALPHTAACGESMVVSWSNMTCGGPACVGLLIARLGVDSHAGWRVLFGIFLDRGDAERLRRRVALAIGRRCVISRILVTGQVLQDALEQNDPSSNAYGGWRR